MIDSTPGVTIGPYRIVRRLGGGEASDVLLATRLFPGGFERRVVIKRLRASDHDALATEAVAYARVAHPAIVQLFDFFVSGEELALVLEYVDGLPLARLVQSLRAGGHRLGDRASMYVMSRVFAALAAAHSARDPATGEGTPVIHRDVNPSNVLVPWDGFVKIGDFDLAKVVGVSSETRSGLLKGTYGYMAPEQVVGETVTPKTDVYGACLVLRELLVGRPAFDSTMPELELLRAMDDANHAPIEALRGGISFRLASAMTSGLARDPHARLAAAEMVDVLRSEADIEVGHAELNAASARVRPRGERGTDRQRSVTPPGQRAVSVAPHEPTAPPTPRAVTLAARESLPPTGASLPPARPGARDRRTQLATGAAIAACVALAGAYVAVVTRATSPEPIDARGAASVAPVPLAGSATASPSEARDAGSAERAAARATVGAIVTPPTARPHRVFIDGRVASYASGGTFEVACGPHAVRIGAAGAAQTVDVPCGGSVTIDAR